MKHLESLSEQGHEQVLHSSDRDSGRMCIIGIHSTMPRPALGRLRR